MFKITKSVIEDFIDAFKKDYPNEITYVFTNGFCYYFAKILHERFDKIGTIMYIPVYNHFCYRLFDKLYDINGEITDEEKISLAESWESYKNQDQLESYRIIRDCILKVEEVEE